LYQALSSYTHPPYSTTVSALTTMYVSRPSGFYTACTSSFFIPSLHDMFFVVC
jgi:hypothetical protein